MNPAKKHVCGAFLRIGKKFITSLKKKQTENHVIRDFFSKNKQSGRNAAEEMGTWRGDRHDIPESIGPISLIGLIRFASDEAVLDCRIRFRTAGP